MRFSTSYMYQRNVDSMSNATVNFNNVYTRLSAGQTLLKPSDDPQRHLRRLSIKMHYLI